MVKITLRFSSEKDDPKVDISSVIKKCVNGVARGRDCCPECGALHFTVQLQYYTIINIHNREDMNKPEIRSFYLRCKRCGYRII